MPNCWSLTDCGLIVRWLLSDSSSTLSSLLAAAASTTIESAIVISKDFATNVDDEDDFVVFRVYNMVAYENISSNV